MSSDLDPIPIPFLIAAIFLAVSPSPEMLYVLARSLRGGRGEGIASSVGTGIGGLGHVVASALGLSALLATSAVASGVIKYAGAAYLIFLGLRTLIARNEETDNSRFVVGANRHALRQGIMTEALNPKTAIFFLAFLPQFIDPLAPAIPQFLLLGSISVMLNTGADLMVALIAGLLGERLWTSFRFRRGQRWVSGTALVGLGTYVAVAGERP